MSKKVKKFRSWLLDVTYIKTIGKPKYTISVRPSGWLVLALLFLLFWWLNS